MQVSVSSSDGALERTSSLYVEASESTESPPMSPKESPHQTVYRGATVDLDLATSPESLGASFSPRSNKKRSKPKRHTSHRRATKKNEAHSPAGNASGNRRSGAPQYVLPPALAEMVTSGEIDLSDSSKIQDVLKKMARQEYKAIVKSTRPCRNWAEKLQMFPSATSYFAYSKNRYRDVLADEATRVRLVGVEHDYINANYVDGTALPGKPGGKFIACQAPLTSTMADFWTMVWQERSCVIVMLTRFREKGTQKSHLYWPKEPGGVSVFGPFEITLVSMKCLMGNIAISTLRVRNAKENEERLVYHLFFTEWPDFGVPRSSRSIRALMAYTNLYVDVGAAQGTSGPIVCHCSAGIGRTGTFIGLHAGISLLEANVMPNVADIVRAMRSARSGMIQTEAQYLFLYEALNDHLQQFNQAKSKPQRMTSASSICALPKTSFAARNRSASAVNAQDVVMEEDERDFDSDATKMMDIYDGT